MAPVHIDLVFSTLTSMYLVRDHFPHEFYEVVQLMRNLVAGKFETMPKADAEVPAMVFRAFTVFPDQKRGVVTDLFWTF
jgi:hypothetical protein